MGVDMFAMGLGEDARVMLLTAAALAPSLHNTQPWRFDVSPNHVRVYRDEQRWLRSEDPTQSGLHISLGAAVLNLRVAAAELRRQASARLLPDPGDPDWVADLWFAEGLGTDPELAAMFPYLAHRRTNRKPFSERPVPERVVQELDRAAYAERGRLRVVRDAAGRQRLLDLAAEASVTELFRHDRLAERARWVGGRRLVDGIPVEALGPRPSDQTPPVRELAVRTQDRQVRPVVRFESQPVLAVLSVAGDDRAHWLQAGQALQRVLLTATRWGLSASFLNQVLDDERLRRLVHHPADGARTPAMVIRFGYGQAPAPTPRRPVDDIGSVK